MIPPTHIYAVIELFPREVVLKNTLLALVLVCFGFVGLSRLSCPNLFTIVYKNYFSTKTYDSTLNDSEKISPFANVMLILNLVITLNICLVSMVRSELQAEPLIQLVFLVTWTYLFVCFISHKVVALLFEDKYFGRSLGLFTQQIFNFTGLVLLVLALFALLNDGYKEWIQYLVYTVVIALPLAKVIKGVLYAKLNNYKWLYIILYLCTLEILPVVLLWHYFVGKI
ncbi:MAG: hypothetical protein CL857_03515 [Cryomorphaceae bacterium]|mgnify:FL=1|nr:hypothetical protein [Cryomorphaceae bacterium]|tara:strand:- start:5213 stop:5890 length:678 start_codon:yes stop_codon:yes gene_type:complete